MSFQGKNYLIVGASSGIGLSIAETLLSNGANVFTASRTQPSISTSHFNWDASAPINEVFNNLPSTLDGLVYCPGTINLKPFNRLTIEDFQKDFQINVLGAISVIQANISRLKSSGNASVVLFSTVAVQTGMGFHASVATSKGAIEGLTRSLAAEYSSSKIRFNAIAPSLTDTPLAKMLLSSPEKIDASNKRHPLGRVGTSNDIAAVAKLLLSNDGSWITGQILHVDGGMGNLK
ncbi:short-chain dehydrogenase/reductase SDR [Emticicia oligotrophica DSM 17448]|uniref:Short-chain dehydrogenase/reductase SDR n=1 Tax=Emticicia oligotrophica (strain DSM 17448 / CIP 109782 / MTCC 6937 / GPTSA100-15) TaxID=929562 RepID=A0ABM5N6Y5_EMTOG|nr:SDR family oxidoreductase [Emticicia oligotrophica]AFK05251.1 short-chain dehydrogenase/reductase SDR [Emticicia oligotrophica DSM 17448]